MKALMQFLSDSVNTYRKMQKPLNLEKRVSPKEYGEYLQKKRKRGHR